jgi:uncharacterized protein involved in type VI secretion and phage assembly
MGNWSIQAPAARQSTESQSRGRGRSPIADFDLRDAGAPVHTDRDHRIKTQFHWQRGSHSSHRLAHPSGDDNAPANDQTGTWVRVATAVAGANWGAVVIPRVGHEVVVAFTGGDIDRPVVIGSAYNAPANDQSGTWVRVASAVAGANWGAVAVPRVGQEVVVAFTDGDIDRPVVIGSAYNAPGLGPGSRPLARLCGAACCPPCCALMRLTKPRPMPGHRPSP